MGPVHIFLVPELGSLLVQVKMVKDMLGLDAAVSN